MKPVILKASKRNCESVVTTPLIAHIHFTPNVAEHAARIVEKVRINPGNYADKKNLNNSSTLTMNPGRT